jgi:hypothetical protein
MKKWWVKALLGMGVLVIAGWLSFLGSTTREKKEVERYRDQLRAAGEKLEIKEFVPFRVAPGQNQTAILRKILSDGSLGFNDAASTNQPSAMHLIFPGRATVGWQQPFVLGSDGASNR